MAQAPELILVTSETPYHGLQEDYTIGCDGFAWKKTGIEGQTHRFLDSMFSSLLSESTFFDSQQSLKNFKIWLLQLKPTQRLQAGIEIISRWHWLWHDQALEANDDDGQNYFCFLAEEIVAELIEQTLFYTAPMGATPNSLVEMVKWSSSGLFDYSEIWPRNLVVQHIQRALNSGIFPENLAEMLELLLYGELNVSQLRAAPENQVSQIQSLLRQCGRNKKSKSEREMSAYAALMRCITELKNSNIENIEQIDISSFYSARSILDASHLHGTILQCILIYLLRLQNHPEVYVDNNKVEYALLQLAETLLRGDISMPICDWTQIIFNPLVWKNNGVSHGVIKQLSHHNLFHQPQIRAALAAARASILVREKAPGCQSLDNCILEDLRKAIHTS